jgi:serine/threonine protein kinase
MINSPKFMAPELVRRETLQPSRETDLYSLAVLLFYVFFIHHPLDGKRELDYMILDVEAQEDLYGHNPVFIFDPDNPSNRPVPGEQDNPILYWEVYPHFLKELFTQAFTRGIKDPDNGRVREGIWRRELVRLRDSILYCSRCGSENFYDVADLQTHGRLKPCWNCGRSFRIPPRLGIEIRGMRDPMVVLLNHDSKLYPHHIEDDADYDFSHPVAEVVQNPDNIRVWGLKNLSASQWVVHKGDELIPVPPGKTMKLQRDIAVNFGGRTARLRA